MKFSLRQLEIFVAIARQESVSSAAASLFLSQSAASMALTELEKQFETQLFDRHGKRLVMNERGQQLLPHCMDLLARAVEIESLLRNDLGVGHLHIGATLTIGNYLATLLIGEFMQRHAGSRVRLAVHNTAMIVEQVVHFKLDFGLIEGDCQHPDLDITPWVDDELVIFAAPDHPLARRTDLTLAELSQQVWILRESGSGTRQVFDAAFRHYLSSLDIRLELEHTEAIKRAVESGMGIGCVSRLALKEAFRRGSLVQLPITGLDLTRKFYFVLHKQKYRTAGIEAFLRLCREVANGVSRSDLLVLRKPDGSIVEYR